MLLYEHNPRLGASDGVSVEQCKRQLGLDEPTCAEIIRITGGNPDVYFNLVRDALLKLAAEKCADYAQGQGVPRPISKPSCQWAIDKIWAGLSASVSWGGPDHYDLQAGRGVEGIHWRRCSNPNQLKPGEHFVPKSLTGTSMCRLNVAIHPRSIVYVPCEHIRNNYSQAIKTSQERGYTYCMDKDGQRRMVDVKTPRAHTGFFTKKGKESADHWPYAFERTPWQSPTRPRPTFVPITTARLFPSPVARYPQGSIAWFDSSINRYRIAIPPGASFGDTSTRYREVETANDPGNAEVVTAAAWKKKMGLSTGKKILLGVGAGITLAVVAGMTWAFVKE